MILPFSAAIVGARFRPPAADVLNNLGGDTPLICVREPDNQHDENAIKVMINIDLVPVEEFLDEGQEPSDVFSIDESDRYQLGYVPRDKAELLASYLDKMGGTCPGKLTFTVEGRPQIEMEISEEEPNA
jgi:hypothetical protein